MRSKRVFGAVYNPRMRTLALVALTGCVTALHPSQPPALPASHDAAAPFALPSHQGQTVTLAASLPAVLVFYRGHW